MALDLRRLSCARWTAGDRAREANAVVGGAAVTETFTPGFRNSVASLHGEPAQSEGDPRSGTRPPRPAHRRAAGRQFLADRRDARPAYALWPRQPAASDCAILSARRRAAARLRRGAGESRGRAARSRPAHATQRRRRHRRAGQGRGLGAAAARPRRRGLASRHRPFHQERRRFSRSVVRERDRQGRVRLRRHRRRLRLAVYARHGLCAAPPLLRRGERQARRVGSRGRRHGRHHPRRSPRRRGRPAPRSARRRGWPSCG